MGLLKRAIRKEEEEGDENLVAKLIDCASEGDAQGIRDLAARGVDLDARGTGEHMENALMVASMDGRLEVRRSSDEISNRIGGPLKGPANVGRRATGLHAVASSTRRAHTRTHARTHARTHSRTHTHTHTQPILSGGNDNGTRLGGRLGRALRKGTHTAQAAQLRGPETSKRKQHVEQHVEAKATPLNCSACCN